MDSITLSAILLLALVLFASAEATSWIGGPAYRFHRWADHRRYDAMSLVLNRVCFRSVPKGLTVWHLSHRRARRMFEARVEECGYGYVEIHPARYLLSLWRIRWYWWNLQRAIFNIRN